MRFWRKTPKHKWHVPHREHPQLALCGRLIKNTEGTGEYEDGEGRGILVGTCGACMRAYVSVEESR